MIIDRPFILLVAPKERVQFKAGEQDVAEELASHWYVLANGRVLDDQPEAPAPEAEAAGEEDEDDEEGEADDTPPAAPSEPPAAPEPPAGDVPPPPADDARDDERSALIAEAEAAGIAIDKRWGIDRIKAALATTKA
jgi:type IV secretory pathway VirB10-like protein